MKTMTEFLRPFIPVIMYFIGCAAVLLEFEIRERWEE